MGVLVEIDIGQKRCGGQTPKAAVALARRIQKTAGLAFMGLQAYQGGLQHKRSLLLRQRACHRAARAVRKYLAEFSRAGIECARVRSEEHTSELQSLMRISYAVFCLKKKKQITQITT